MKDKIFGVLQRVGRSFMLPIAILPVAGLFLGIGGSFTNVTMLESYNLMKILGPGTFAYAILSVLKAAGAIVFDNLPVIFAMGVAIGMAKKEKEVAALAGAIAFFIMHASIGAMIDINGGTDAMLAGSTISVLGITSLQMGVFGGIIVGLGVAALHNRFYKIELPQVLSFFGGTRFVPIISAVVYLFVGILLFYIWPTVQNGIYAVGDLVCRSGYAGTWLYGLMERLLIPFGLHHVFYLPFWQTAVGGTAEVSGHLVEGAQNIFFAELGAKDITHFNVDATRFMSGKFPLMIFGLPGAALAMYRCAEPSKRKAAGGLLLSAALTSMLTGITEPLEFTFLFVAPALYAIHCVFAGFAYMLMHMLNVGVGMTFSGGFIDMFLFGILQGNSKTNWIYIVLVGIVYFIVYYFLFKFLILKFNFKTPGREDDDQEVKLYTRADVNAAKADKSNPDNKDDEVSAYIISGLGGRDNISDIDCCATRLRITVNNGELVNEKDLKASGAAGIIQKGNGVQVIYGPQVTVIKSKLEDYLEKVSLMPKTAEEKVTVTKEESENVIDKKKETKDVTDKKKDAQNIADKNNETQNIANKNNEVKNVIGNKKEVLNATNKKDIISEESKSVETILYAPIKGKVVTLEDVGDGVFSAGMLGKGIAIEPDLTASGMGRAVSPVKGTVTMVFDTKHAIGLTSDSGVEILIHIGLDTVQLNGKYYTTHVKTGDQVNVGDLLVEFDISGIKKAGYSVITPIIITNTDEYEMINEVKTEFVEEQDVLLKIKSDVTDKREV